jgi:GrpB-like predicted nucleotidyltransferase (UPF0157 family)
MDSDSRRDFPRSWRQLCAVADAGGASARSVATRVPKDSTLWRGRTAFYDALRCDAPLATEYAELKLCLAVMRHRDRETYSEAKVPFMRRALKLLDVTVCVSLLVLCASDCAHHMRSVR